MPGIPPGTTRVQGTVCSLVWPTRERVQGDACSLVWPTRQRVDGDACALRWPTRERVEGDACSLLWNTRGRDFSAACSLVWNTRERRSSACVLWWATEQLTAADCLACKCPCPCVPWPVCWQLTLAGATEAFGLTLNGTKRLDTNVPGVAPTQWYSDLTFPPFVLEYAMACLGSADTGSPGLPAPGPPRRLFWVEALHSGFGGSVVSAAGYLDVGDDCAAAAVASSWSFPVTYGSQYDGTNPPTHTATGTFTLTRIECGVSPIPPPPPGFMSVAPVRSAAPVSLACVYRSEEPLTAAVAGDPTGRAWYTCCKPGFERQGKGVSECDGCSVPADRRCGSLTRCPGYEAADPDAG